jgi:hypothetical protein
MALNTMQIDAFMRNDPIYLKTLALNQLKDVIPPTPFLPLKMIINLQTQNLPGDHWVAIVRNANRIGYYFDSYGEMPPLPIQHWLANNCSEWHHNYQQVQHDSDNLSCGYLCIIFLQSF